MTKRAKTILLVFIIGIVVFIIANALSDGFAFKSVNEFLVEFIFYQLYSFVLGYSNMGLLYVPYPHT